MNGPTIKIEGKEFPALVSPDGLRIVTPELAYVLHPLCTESGMPLQDGYGKRGQLPSGAPVELRRRTFRAPYPDWTDRYPEDTARHWKLRQDYVANMTLERFQHDFGATDDAQRDAVRLEEFRKAENDFETWLTGKYGGIYWVFHDHATPEQIEEVEGPEMLQLGLAAFTRDAAGRFREAIEWEARYNDKAQSVIYLRHLQEAPHTPDEAAWARSLQPVLPASTTARVEKTAALFAAEVKKQIAPQFAQIENKQKAATKAIEKLEARLEEPPPTWRVTFKDGYRRVFFDGQPIDNFPKAVKTHKLFRLLDEARKAGEPWLKWEQVATDCGFENAQAKIDPFEVFKHSKHRKTCKTILLSEFRNEGPSKIRYVRLAD